VGWFTNYPAFASKVAAQDWLGAANVLKNWGGAFANRRRYEGITMEKAVGLIIYISIYLFIYI
jgi:hypothetical protein